MTELTQKERSELRRSVENRKSEYGRLVADAERLAETEAALRREANNFRHLSKECAELGDMDAADNWDDAARCLQRILDGGEKDE